MVPKGWKLSTFGNHVDCLTGFPFKSKNYSDNSKDIRLLRGDNIEPSRLRWKDAKYWPANEYEQLEKFHLRKGDFVVAMDRTWVSSGLKVAEVRDTDVPCLLVQRVARIRALPSLDQSLLGQYFSDHKFEQYVKSVQTATAVPHISPNHLKDFSFLLPPINEQEKIAKILSIWDKAIDIADNLLKNSLQQKKALMQKLLTGKQRLKAKDGKKFSKEWEWVKAKELFRPTSKKNNPENEELLAVTQELGVIPRSLLDRRVVMPSGGTNGYKLVVPSNFIISLRSFQGGLEYSRYRGLVSPAYTVLEPITDIISDFYRHYFKSYDFIGHLAVAVIGIRDGKQISYEDFSFLKLPKPNLQEQREIAAVLSFAHQETEALQQKLNHLKQEKKALMQQLLTGKRRVKVDPA